MLGQCIWCATEDSIVIHRANPSSHTHKQDFTIHYNTYVGIVNKGLTRLRRGSEFTTLVGHLQNAPTSLFLACTDLYSSALHPPSPPSLPFEFL